jgi:hypothetical protein
MAEVGAASRMDPQAIEILQPVAYEDAEGQIRIGWASPGLDACLRRQQGQSSVDYEHPKTQTITRASG